MKNELLHSSTWLLDLLWLSSFMLQLLNPLFITLLPSESRSTECHVNNIMSLITNTMSEDMTSTTTSKWTFVAESLLYDNDPPEERALALSLTPLRPRFAQKSPELDSKQTAMMSSNQISQPPVIQERSRFCRYGGQNHLDQEATS